MAAQLPRVLKNMNFYPDGMSFAGRIDSLTPPTLALLLEDHRAGGMDAPKKIEMGMEAMTMTALIPDMDPDVQTLLGVDGKMFLIRGGFQAQGQNVEPVLLTTRGMLSRIEPAEWRPGTKSVHTLTFELDYFKYRQRDVEHIEIDVLGMVRRIGPVDHLAQQRAAIGL